MTRQEPREQLPLADAITRLPQDVRAIAPQSLPQMHFLQCDADVAIYGGAAGGG